MRTGTLFTLKRLLAGQTIARIRMNEALSRETLRGKVVDVGGGRRPDYFDFFQQEQVTSIESLDGSISGIDFEKDALPYADGSVDTAILCNVLEHVYHHSFLLGEIARILAPEGRIIGFVPFWVGYHPDPHDYFRYTREAIEQLLADAGFVDIRVRTVGGGPFMANYNTIILSMPRFIRPIAYLPYVGLDRLFLAMRPRSAERYPLGFIFSGTARSNS